MKYSLISIQLPFILHDSHTFKHCSISNIHSFNSDQTFSFETIWISLTGWLEGNGPSFFEGWNIASSVDEGSNFNVVEDEEEEEDEEDVDKTLIQIFIRLKCSCNCNGVVWFGSVNNASE